MVKLWSYNVCAICGDSKMCEAIFQILKEGRSLELCIVSYQLLQDINKALFSASSWYVLSIYLIFSMSAFSHICYWIYAFSKFSDSNGWRWMCPIHPLQRWILSLMWPKRFYKFANYLILFCRIRYFIIYLFNFIGWVDDCLHREGMVSFCLKRWHSCKFWRHKWRAHWLFCKFIYLFDVSCLNTWEFNSGC